MNSERMTNASGVAPYSVCSLPIVRAKLENFALRIAMTAAVASIVSEGSVIIEESESVKKSYPHFFEDFKRLGGICVE